MELDISCFVCLNPLVVHVEQLDDDEVCVLVEPCANCPQEAVE